MKEDMIYKILKEIIKRKVFIFGFTIICIMATYATTEFLLQKQYTLTQSLSVKPIFVSGIQQRADNIEVDELYSNVIYDKILSVVLNSVNYPVIQNNELINYVYSEKFKNKFYKYYDPGTVSYEVERINKSDNISIIIKSDSKDKTRDVLEYFKQTLFSVIQEDLEKQIQNIETSINEGIAEENVNLNILGNELEKLNNITISHNANNINYRLGNEYESIMTNYLIAKETFESYNLIKKEIQINKNNTQINNKITFHEETKVIKLMYPNMGKNLMISLILGFLISLLIVTYPIINNRIKEI